MDACILTDSTAQLLDPSIKGKGNIIIFPEDFPDLAQKWSPTSVGYGQNRFFSYATDQDLINKIPSVDDFRTIFSRLSETYRQILGIFPSASINNCYAHAVQAVESCHPNAEIYLIDSQTISAGLGIVIQKTLEYLRKGYTVKDINNVIREIIPKIYSLLCIPKLKGLYYQEFLDLPQAVIAEMLGLFPIFSIEEGILKPIEKVRNQKLTFDFYLEFLEEFDLLDYIVFVDNPTSQPQDRLRFIEQVRLSFPKSIIYSISINSQVANILGPATMGLFLLEK